MNREINFKLVIRMLGRLLLSEGTALLLVFFISLIYGENDGVYFIFTSLLCYVVGFAGFFFGKNAPMSVGKREGSLVVTSAWIIFSLFGSLPFWLSKSIPLFTDAFFETISGFTTTGASILNNIEELSHSMLFWRSLTHWMGGLGIIVISLALLPMFGTSGAQLFAAESSGPTKDKIHPKISETAKRLFVIYFLLTFSETILLRLGGMTWFDAVCHSFATIATGGFSTKQNSIQYWDSPYIQYTIIIFMILSGVNFSLYYFGFKNKLEKIRQNEELRYYLIVLFGFAIIVALSMIDFSRPISFHKVEESWRNALFTVGSLMSTTGFTTVDYMQWKPFVWVILLIVMLTGASAGSTSGAIKMVRIVIVFKFCYYEFKRLIHPKAVVPVRYSGKIVFQDVVTRVLVFVLLYLIAAILGILILCMSGVNFIESVGGLVACLGGVGPGLGMVGPVGNYSYFPVFAKWFLSFMMLLGRLELFTVLLLFTPAFWKK